MMTTTATTTVAGGTSSAREMNDYSSCGSEKSAAAAVTAAERSPSPVRAIDPWVRAVHTVMHGLVVHFGTVWWIRGSSDGDDDDRANEFTTTTTTATTAATFPLLLLLLLLLHEYWVYLQHCNVLANPFCQRLDRQYGIALLKSNQHAAIAGTLAAYWCRESVSLVLCLPYLMPATATHNSNSNICYWILYSLVYHTIKSRGVRRDAQYRCSPAPFGILRAVMDRFYVHTPAETARTAVRLALQGLDTWIHLNIVRGLFQRLHEENAGVTAMMHALFAIWVVHAALNQLFRCSTATAMVQAWKFLSGASANHNHPRNNRSSSSINSIRVVGDDDGSDKNDRDDDNNKDHHHDDDDDSTQAESSVSSSDESTITEQPQQQQQQQQPHQSQERRPGRETTTTTTTTSTTTVSTTIVGSDDPDDADTDFVVRQLLAPGRAPLQAGGAVREEGAAAATTSGGVDAAVRMETAVTVLAAVFLLVGDEAPLRILAMPSPPLSTPLFARGLVRDDPRRLLATLPHAWFLGSLLYGIGAVFLKTTSRRAAAPNVVQRRHGSHHRQRSLVNLADLGVTIFATANGAVPKEVGWTVAALLTWKSFLQASHLRRRSRLVGTFLRATEFLAKAAMVRFVTGKAAKATAASGGGIDDYDTATVSAVLSVLWVIWVASHPLPTPCEEVSSEEKAAARNVANVVFLGHPAELSDCWALWLLPYPLKERWQPPLWALPLWPLHYLVGWYVCNYRRKLFGDGASFFCCDDVDYGGTRMQTWTAAHFGRHFVTHPRRVKQNIEAAARHAERIGVKVLCLGALNKAESINGGGVGVAQALGAKRKLSVIHGNHLTAAVVVQTVHQCFGDQRVKLFLTGASSKVGWAVARALRDRYGYEILCHSTDQGRRRFFEENGFASASTLSEGTAYSKFWIVGKYDRAVTQLIPQNGTAIVFSVPHALESRRDVKVIEAGTLHMDLSKLDRPRRFTNKLRVQEIFACHAASTVAALRLKKDGVDRIDETGPVDPDAMDTWLADAMELGFRIPHVEPVEAADIRHVQNSGKPPVVIVGAGPAGLAVAAYLTCQKIPNLILESQEDPTAFGSWEHQFTGLEVTSQKKWCNLPGFAMSDEEFPGETVTAEEYRHYLKLYAARFGMDIQRGVCVESVEKRTTEHSPWIARCRGMDTGDENGLVDVAAWSVIVATGKHRIPRRNTSDNVVGQLVQSQIPQVHSTDLCNDATWTQAIQAAQNGRLCIVGFGNSAADLATMILHHCHAEGGHDEQDPNNEHEEGTSSGPRIHLAARTVPPVFPRRRGVLRVDTLGYFVRWMPAFLQEVAIRLLWWGIPSSRQCDAAFPSHLPRWNQIQGRVPVVDKYGVIASGFQSGQLVGHGPILDITSQGKVRFQDRPLPPITSTPIPSAKSNSSSNSSGGGLPMDMAILAIGYQNDSCSISIGREDRLNGLYKCGFGNDRLLPLKSIAEEAKVIAEEVASSYR